MKKLVVLALLLAGCQKPISDAPDTRFVEFRLWPAVAYAEMHAKPSKPVEPTGDVCPNCNGRGRSGDGHTKCIECNGTGKRAKVKPKAKPVCYCQGVGECICPIVDGKRQCVCKKQTIAQAKAASKKNGKPVLTLLTAPAWCLPCRKLEATLRQVDLSRFNVAVDDYSDRKRPVPREGVPQLQTTGRAYVECGNVSREAIERWLKAAK